MDLLEQIADVVQLTDETNVDKVAEVVIDTITSYLTQANVGFAGALTPAIELLSLNAERARLRREN